MLANERRAFAWFLHSFIWATTPKNLRSLRKLLDPM
jgi:hypothetical protein